jgi:hypothetical protein
MQHPWNVPPFPSDGDATEDITFTSVGRALTGWELFEHEIAALFAAILGPSAVTWTASRSYGSVLTFRGRSDMIKAAAEAHFAQAPNNVLHAGLRDLLNLANNYSPRRNEIAHAVVKPYASLALHGDKKEFVLVPSDYATNKMQIGFFSQSLLTLGIPATQEVPYLSPKYVYSSPEIDYFGIKFRSLIPLADSLCVNITKTRPS